MKRLVKIGIFGLLGIWTGAGCPSGSSQPDGNGGHTDNEPQVVAVQLDDTGVFDLEDGVPVEKTGMSSVPFSGQVADSATISIDPADLSITNAEPAKILVSMQGTATINITVWVSPIDSTEEACGAGVEYGPFVVTLDGDLQPVSVSPPTLALLRETLEILGEFRICIRVELNGARGRVVIRELTFEVQGGNGMGDHGDSNGGGTNHGDCNPECGFQNGFAEGRAAAAICDIYFPSDTGQIQGSVTDGSQCTNNADCEDGDECTENECIGAVVFVCSSTRSTNCGADSNPIVRNGDEVYIDFDHSIVSATVNGQPTFNGGSSWIPEGLAPGPLTLLIEWENRPGSNPTNGCHVIEVTVVP